MRPIKEMIVDIGGKPYRMSSDDLYLESMKDGFEPQTVQLLRTLVRSGDIVLDVGANIGFTAIACGEIAQTVFAFEPSKTSFAFLQANVEKSGLRNVVVQNIGLGAVPEESTLTYRSANRSGGFVSATLTWPADCTVERISLLPMDDIVDSLGIERVHFIKLDVEGFELHVLRGGARTISTHRPLVMLEMNHWCLNAFQRTSIPDFLDQLRAMFPILLAVEGSTYLDLNNSGERFSVMHSHILNMKYLNIVAAFDELQVANLKSSYRHGPCDAVSKSATVTTDPVRGLKAEDVIWAYRLCLDRDPENADAIQHHMSLPSRNALVMVLLNSPEYKSRFGG